MFSRKSVVLFVLLASLAVFSFATVMRAQESTPVPTPDTEMGEVPSTGGSDAVVPDEPIGTDEAFQSLLWLSAAVAFAMEFAKSAIIAKLPYVPRLPDPADPTRLIPDVRSTAYVVTIQVAAFIAAMLLVFALNDPRNNILAALGVFPRTPLWFAQLLTGLTVSFGNLFLHGLSDFFGKARGTVVAVDGGSTTLTR